MRYTTKTEYGIVGLLYMAQKGDGCVNIKEIASQEKFSTTYIEKIFQKLRSANIVKSFQGADGGYALARPSSEITLKQVIEALEGTTFDVFCGSDTQGGVVCTHSALCSLSPIWAKTKSVLDNFYDSITLDDIIHKKVTEIKAVG